MPEHSTPPRIPVAEVGELPPYDAGRTLHFWFLYDWESREKQLLLEPPPLGHVYRRNEKLYRCRLDVDPPHTDKSNLITGKILFEEGSTKEPLGQQTLAYYLARRLFYAVPNMLPPPPSAESRGFEIGFGRAGNFYEPEMTLISPWGGYRIVVEKIAEAPQHSEETTRLLADACDTFLVEEPEPNSFEVAIRCSVCNGTGLGGASIIHETSCRFAALLMRWGCPALLKA